MENPKLFTLIRHADESGISGVGRVLNGVVFHTGQVHVHIHPHPDDQTAIRFGAEASFDESLG